MSTPTQFFDAAQAALDCVCAQMDELAAQIEDYPGCSCLAFVSAGEPVIDCCVNGCEDNGMLAVHVENIYPSDAFPGPSEGFEPCKAATWVAALVVTVTRCAPSFADEDGTPVPAEDLTANARILAIDSYAVLTALGCCLVNEPPAGKRKRRVLILGSTPVTQEGGCVGVEVRALVDTGQVCSCGSES